MSKKTDLQRAIDAASKRLPILSERKLNGNLEMFCGSFAEAYKIGAEEAQREIISRLREIPPDRPATVATPPESPA